MEFKKLCLSCGCITTKQNRRLLSTEGSRSIAIILSKLYKLLLQERREQLEVEHLYWIVLTDGLSGGEGFVCLKCFKTLTTFYDKEEMIKSRIAKVLDKLPTTPINYDDELLPVMPAAAVTQQLQVPASTGATRVTTQRSRRLYSSRARRSQESEVKVHYNNCAYYIYSR